ncbi:hypothetical protein ACHAXH_006764 [Discostella pseudostelligera]
MKKTRIVTRVKDKTGIAKSKNRSEDLDDLRSKYQQFSKNLKFLITTLTNQHAALVAHSKARLEVAKAINSLTVDTPLFKLAGDIPATAVGTADGGTDLGNDAAAAASAPPTTSELVTTTQQQPTSYAAIHLQLHKKNKMYHDKYNEHILNYAIEWERILSTRIKGHLAQSEKLRLDLDHYGRKVEDLSRTINKTMAKGKNIDDKEVDKLKRNEQKLAQSRIEYDRFVNDLCGFMEEVMERGWKDLHPLLVKMAQFDTTLSNEEATILKNSMTSVTTQLKGMGAQHPHLKPMGRLKELETWSLESLAKANPSTRSDSPLMITQGGGEDATYFAPLGDNPNGVHGIHAGLGSGSTDELSVGGGGIFGRQQMSRNPSFASNAGSETSYGQMMPRSRTNTGDGSIGSGGHDWATGGVSSGVGGGGLFGAHNNNRQSNISAAPSSGGLPPLNPSYRGNSYSSSSHDLRATSSMLSTMQAAAPPPTLQDIFSSNAGPSNSMMAAPPPVGMPPPPPSMPPPPPPLSNSMTVAPLSLYDNYHVPSTQQLQYNSMSSSMPANTSGVITPQSAKSDGSTNPFDDGGAAPNYHGNSYTSNNPTPMHSNVYGGGGGASTNPFGM